MLLTFIIEHDLLTEPLCLIMVSTSVPCLTIYFIERGSVIGENAQKRCASGTRTSKDKHLFQLAHSYTSRRLGISIPFHPA